MTHITLRSLRTTTKATIASSDELLAVEATRSQRGIPQVILDLYKDYNWNRVGAMVLFHVLITYGKFALGLLSLP